MKGYPRCACPCGVTLVLAHYTAHFVGKTRMADTLEDVMDVEDAFLYETLLRDTVGCIWSIDWYDLTFGHPSVSNIRRNSER